MFSLKFDIVIASLIFLFSCSKAPKVAVAPDFDDDERIAIVKAAATWNGVVEPGHRISTDGGPWKLLKQIPPDYATKSYIGETDWATKTIWIQPGLSDRVFYLTVLHEFGHALGLHHVQGAAIMNPTIGTAESFTDADMTECKRVGACINE